MVTKTDQLLKEFINLHPKYIDLSLNRLKYLLKKLGNPHNNLPPTIHIAGTNGKGSTLSFIKNILENNNYSVHTYTSPHLEKFSERIHINSKQVNANRLLRSLEYIKKINQKKPITFFEITTAAAFHLFSKHKADFLILETGLGGRLDATNIIPKKLISIITSIGIDHEEFLGNTLKKIAIEKLGIIKNTKNVIIAKQNKEVDKFILEKLKNQKNVHHFNHDYKFKSINSKQFVFKFQKIEKIIRRPLLQGIHQIENASTALTAAMILKKNNFNIKLSSLGKSIYNTKWPGRIEKVKFKNKYIILDGSHNLAGAEKLNQYLKESNARPNVIFGMLNNKKAFEFLSILKKNIDTLYPIKIPDEKNAYTQEEIYNISKELHLITVIKKNLGTINQSLMNKSNKYILITGSLYLIGKIRKNYL
ncbi:MAG: bifunctional folylpolyglutamate synthase/dihydrofolate synthase [Pelagibacteraceae bacterium]|nr:bifunctional folylpolyglutamate synthase/dihydrofolate synthase [Pelagibacteraceae bacterium]MBT4645294.1 bifunctional folylpolyglutamate synthase/dihydrofolate synthase [Pelagibacteraceae bacterium]MBT4950299.1 bifunctional folylpolyglutamate synthase/dihydrofolate synthase [Pelagibacteraceae bacterium]